MSTTQELVERLQSVSEWKQIIERHRRITDDPRISYVLQDGTRVHEDENVIAKLAASLSRALEGAADTASAAAERLSELERENAALSQWEWLNDWDDPEYGSWDSISGAAEDIDGPEVRRVTASRIVSELWIAHRCLSVDDEGDPDETEAVAFKTAEEAERCWPESLAKARAALAGSEKP